MRHPILDTEIDLNQDYIDWGDPWILNLLPEEIGHPVFANHEVDGHYLRVKTDEMGDEKFINDLVEAGFVSFAVLWLHRLQIYKYVRVVPNIEESHKNLEFTKVVTNRAKKLLDLYEEDVFKDEDGYTILIDCMELLKYTQDGWLIEEDHLSSLTLEHIEGTEGTITFEGRFDEIVELPASIQQHYDDDDGYDHGCDPEDVFILNWTKPMLEAGVSLCRRQIEFLRGLHHPEEMRKVDFKSKGIDNETSNS